jgi:phosphatidylserine/phosphatidylglycerophosphate/cardiolipin synthase-like enzyme
VCQITTKDFPASWQQACGAAVLIEAGIDTKIDASHPDAHNKIITIDGVLVITGSFNFSQKAELSNSENLLIIPQRSDESILSGLGSAC